MAAMATVRAWLTVKPHIPMIKFRKGGITGNDLRATQAAPSPSDPAKARLTAPPKPILEDWQLPKKYQRQPLSDLEIEYINYGGPPPMK
ncbi:28S ribosomal protein S36, mitochondrial isoform X2 [Ischnura elegans]|uniref:28S ribosomal protein S36, mitochondrial isoform X2 n=1 Tax=Ischnura elegans TaxID=197161 RepID=UPI001ED8BDF2|nr:28S ribosomal protein S36, mitochondrial isoform X2 [Ischnura elegans]